MERCSVRCIVNEQRGNSPGARGDGLNLIVISLLMMMQCNVKELKGYERWEVRG